MAPATLLRSPPTLDDALKRSLLRVVALNINNEAQARRDWPEGHSAGWPADVAVGSRGFVGESILVVSPGGKTMIIDAAWPSGFTLREWGQIDYGENRVGAYLKSLGITTIDWLVASHSHWDHIGGMPELVRDPDLKVGKVLWSPLPDELFLEKEPDLAATCIEMARDLLAACEERGVNVSNAAQGEVLDLGGGVTCEVLAAAIPELEVPSFVNNNSIVMRLAYGDFSMMLTGDAGFHAEDRVMALGRDLTTDVLKLGHHAGNNSTGDGWLKALSPRVGVASMPRWLSEDERGRRVEGQLAPLGVRFYRTWEHGDVEVQTDGSSFWVVTER